MVEAARWQDLRTEKRLRIADKEVQRNGEDRDAGPERPRDPAAARGSPAFRHGDPCVLERARLELALGALVVRRG